MRLARAGERYSIYDSRTARETSTNKGMMKILIALRSRAVVGVGQLATAFHRHYSMLPGVAIVDINTLVM